MKQVASLLAFALFFAANTQAMAMELKDFQEYQAKFGGKKQEEQNPAVMAHIEGLMRGVMVSNSLLTANKQPPLFCPGKAAPMSFENVIKILQKEIESPIDKKPYESKMPLEVIMLNALFVQYPCK
jgi:hypothetical protein